MTTFEKVQQGKISATFLDALSLVQSGNVKVISKGSNWLVDGRFVISKYYNGYVTQVDAVWLYLRSLQESIAKAA